nr:immunoglobulin light chain junction region [Macaca mulatta]MPO05082.1 immunoglobulin light chain junction region [Macaca mulatta]MPO05332.1 immunoglobulin light chain junction region [Macaca mulatta]MPO06405.1 immunoglobulin light chain junction region [Macaca mulatta]MPO06581.1 immunoglobulin light chain junction region [Macaca mulatta]
CSAWDSSLSDDVF